MEIQASGNMYKPYSYLDSNLISDLDFFDHPITVTLDGIEFEVENGADSATQCLYFKLNSTMGLSSSSAVEILVYGNGNIKVDIIKNGVSTRTSATMDYVPESIVVYLDDTDYEVKFYHSKGIIKTIQGTHGLTAADWSSTGAYLVFRGVRFSSEDKWVKFSFEDLKCFNGAIWRELVPELGKYSRSYQYMDWSDEAQMGENIAMTIDHNDSRWQYVNGESARESVVGLDDYRISDVFLKVDWAATAPDYSGTTLYSIKNCKRVTIQNVGIIQEDNNIGRDTIRILNCEEVYIKNLYISGSASHNHLVIEGAKYVVIDKVHIAGAVYSGISGSVCSKGICITTDENDENQYIPEFFVIQNSYIHDFDSDTTWLNRDGIEVASAGSGIIFNNCVRNWQSSCADGGLDISHRREDTNYSTDHLIRIERNFIDNCSYVKNPGISHLDNKVIWCNNLFYDVAPIVYHYQYSVYRVHDTYIYENFFTHAFRFWNTSTDFNYILNNCLVYAYGGQKLSRIFWNTQPGDKRTSVFSDYNLYYLKEDPIYFYQDALIPSYTVDSFYDWQLLGKDINSVKTNTGTLFTDVGNGDYTMALGTIAKGIANLDYLNNSNPGLQVQRDFFGYYRSTTEPCVGAFDYGSRTPFTGLPPKIPGIIEAENFDNGGEGSAYHDDTAGNTGGELRTDEDVDIYIGDDTLVVSSSSSEYLKYTVEVESTGPYRIDARVAGYSSVNRTFTIYIDGVLIGAYSFQNGLYHTAVVVASVTLPKGLHEVKVLFNNSGIKLNYLEFVEL